MVFVISLAVVVKSYFFTSSVSSNNYTYDKSIVANKIPSLTLEKYKLSLDSKERIFVDNLTIDGLAMKSAILKIKDGALTSLSEESINKAMATIEGKTLNVSYLVRRSAINDKIYGIQIYTVPTVTSVILCLYFPNNQESDFILRPSKCSDPYIL